MGIRKFAKSSAFVVILFAIVVVLIPFALEEIANTTNMFSFPAKATVLGWFMRPGENEVASDSYGTIEWSLYKKSIEEFDEWAVGCKATAVSKPSIEDVVSVTTTMDDTGVERKIWPVPVASCTAADSSAKKKGYFFMTGIDRPFKEGTFIEPSGERCGYEIVSIGERSVWLRVVFESEGDTSMGIVNFPDFTRVDGETLVKGKGKYVAQDTFQLSSGGWMMLHSFIPPDGAVFKKLDDNRRVVATILCIVIGEKGGK